MNCPKCDVYIDDDDFWSDTIDTCQYCSVELHRTCTETVECPVACTDDHFKVACPSCALVARLLAKLHKTHIATERSLGAVRKAAGHGENVGNPKI